jgi:RimJ/RimL family protein N-acetyltransferase
MDAVITLPLRTERLVLRMPIEADAPAVVAYRNDPEVARFQDWELPVTPERVLEGIRASAGRTGLVVGVPTNVAIEHGGAAIGDLYVEIGGSDAGGAVATLGYTLDPAHQGHGFATEAAGAMVDALFAHTQVHRITATLDPANLASMRVLDHLGFTHEGVSRRSVPVRGEWVDDLRHGLLRDERSAWLARPTSFAALRLVELDEHLARTYGALQVHPHQTRFVTSVLGSYRDALFPETVDGARVVPWMRGVEVTDHSGASHPAGFVMLAEVTDAHPEPYLWRLLVDRRWQRAGVGRAVLDRLVALAREQGCSSLLTSWVEGPGGPRRFYERLGFVPTGRIIDGETEARLPL